jgi:hypothetical protein
MLSNSAIHFGDVVVDYVIVFSCLFIDAIKKEIKAMMVI